ncbi:MAG: DUF6933 domain-containing protein, partial [Chitinophagaceae bacterium]
VHKETFYSFVLMDVKKKDFSNLKNLFIEGFVTQLKKDQLFSSVIEKKIPSISDEPFVLSTTDSDRSTIGYINDCIYRLTVYQTSPEYTIEDLYVYIDEYYNNNYITVKKYQKPIDLMRQSLFI